MSDDLDYTPLPESLRKPMCRYYELGILPGDFLQAVLANNLMQSLGRASGNNRQKLWTIVRWCHNELPHGAWGSPEKMKAWANQGGHKGQ